MTRVEIALLRIRRIGQRVVLGQQGPKATHLAKRNLLRHVHVPNDLAIRCFRRVPTGRTKSYTKANTLRQQEPLTDMGTSPL